MSIEKDERVALRFMDEAGLLKEIADRRATIRTLGGTLYPAIINGEIEEIQKLIDEKRAHAHS